MTTYAVTGATGPFGRHAVEELLSRGIAAADVVAVVRTPSKAADLAERGVQVREGDYSRPETLPAALAGVQRLLLVSGSEVGARVAQHTAVVDAAKAAGVERIAYTSLLRADTSSNPLAGEHRATEQVLRDSGITSVILRNGWYLENYTSQLGQYLEHGAVLGAAGDGVVSGAARADYAAAAVTALLDDTTGDVTYELGGAGFTLADLASTVTDVTGTTVVYRDVSVTEYAAALQGMGLDEGTAGFVSFLDASIAAGDLHTDSDDLARLVGRPLVTLADAVRAAQA
jgi:NAD(P)H dehydrogenase (quinone)